MLRAHLAAVRVLLEPLTAPPSSTPVIVGDLDDAGKASTAGVLPVTPYVMVRPDSFPMVSDRLAQWSANVNGRLYVTCVGGTVAEAQWAQERTRDLLLDKRPVVAGRSVAPLALVDGQPLQSDRDTTPPLLFVVDVYRYSTFPG